MFKRMTKSLIGAFLVCTPLLAAAGTGWTNFDVIQQIAQEPSSVDGTDIYISMTNTTTNPSGCTSANGFYFGVVDDRTKRMFVSLTAAQLTGKAVELYVTGVCGIWGYAQIDGIAIQS